MAEKKNDVIDLAIIGAGAAGITAAIYAVRRGLSVRVFDKGAGGGLSADAIEIENYPGVGKVKGSELMEAFENQLNGFGVKVEKNSEVVDVKKVEGIGSAGKGGRGEKGFGAGGEGRGGFEIEIEGKGKVKAGAVILATGTEYRRLGVKGEKELFGAGVSYCAVCDGAFFRGKRVVVVGGGNSALTAAVYLSEIAKVAGIFEFGEKAKGDEVYIGKLKEKGIVVEVNSEVVEVLGEEKVEGVRVRDRKTGKEREVKADGVFILIGMVPHNEIAKKMGLKLDERGYVKTDETRQSSMKGVFIAGDISGSEAQTIVAAAEGAIAALRAYDYIKGI